MNKFNISFCYNKYFFLDVKPEVKDSDAVFGTPGLSDGVSSVGITVAEGRGGQSDNLERPTHHHQYIVGGQGDGFTTTTSWSIDYTGDGGDIEPNHMHGINDMLVSPSRNPWEREDHAHTLSVGRNTSSMAGHIPRGSNLQDDPFISHTHNYFFATFIPFASAASLLPRSEPAPDALRLALSFTPVPLVRQGQVR